MGMERWERRREKSFSKGHWTLVPSSLCTTPASNSLEEPITSYIYYPSLQQEQQVPASAESTKLLTHALQHRVTIRGI